MLKKQVLSLVVLVLIFLIVDQYYLNIIKFGEQTETRPGTKYILYWTDMFDRADFYFGFGDNIFENCPVSNCFATNNKSLLPVDEFDAVLFHGVEFNVNFYGIPTKRSAKQVYVYSNQEAPANTPLRHMPRDFFNWTMTYRSDSDIIRPYGFFEKSPTDYQPPTIEDIKNKKRKIAWMVSNCYTSSRRKELYKKINKYIKVDVYGICGNLTCAKENAEECYKLLENNYKFYLSFENSLCKDYATEKLFNILKRNLVPIVYGDARYAAIAPPYSVINVLEYRSVKELVKHLMELDGNVTEYLRYFEWKKHYLVNTSNKLALCRLCEKLNEPLVETVYTDVNEWWRQSGICRKGIDLPHIMFH
ncbi:hypothetical protein JTB14_013394 [Gonioctena quinquepunctata]|nr:hypothetical protein JTB14_013394 [Gonioctena quinquepunctata]